MELKDLQRRTGITFVYVTHDQAEAMALSDRIAVLHGACSSRRRPARGLRAAGQPRGRRLHGPRQPAPGPGGACRGRRQPGLGRRRRARPVSASAALADGAASRWRSGREPPPGARRSLAAPARGPRGKLADVTFLGNLIDCHVVLDDGTRVRVQADPARRSSRGRRSGSPSTARRAPCSRRDEEGRRPSGATCRPNKER